MDKLSSWLFLLIAVVWLLPLIGVETTTNSLDWGKWVAAISLAIIATFELMKK
jgi:hypothetical protein